jgi:flagellin-like hook-associated protein FlgL
MNFAAHNWNNWIKSMGWFSPRVKRVNTCEAPSILVGSATRNAPVTKPVPDNNGVDGAQLFLRAQDSYLQQVGSALDQMSVLASESQDVNKTDEERAALQQEFSTLAGYITDIATKDFNSISLFSGSLLIVTIPNNDGTCKIPGISLTLPAYTRATAACIATSAGAMAAFQAVMAAINQLDTDRAAIVAGERQLFRVNKQLVAHDEEQAAAKN